MNPRRSNSSLPRTGRSAYGVATAAVLLLIPLVVLLGGTWLQEFLNFGAGVLSLVCLTCSVIWGLVAQDRMILNTRQRIIAQGIHRVTAVAAIAFLLVHIGVKLALDHASPIAAIIPFSLLFAGGSEIPGSAFLIGLGSLAALLMIFVGVTGALRNQFASPAPVAARWRAMHMLAYPAWCAALIHGLFAGRPAKTFFMVSYELCVVAVAAALALRAAPRPVKRKVADRLAQIIGNEPGLREDLEESRARAASGSSLPGYEDRRPGRGPRDERRSRDERTGPLPGMPSQPPSAAETTGGFAAAYRAVNPRGRQQQPYADQTSRMDLPMDMQPTEAMPRVDGSSSSTGNWPIPSPPPVGEAPPSSYDPLNDTSYNIPVYDNSGTTTYGSNTSGYGSNAAGYGSSDVYDTSETNAVFGTYNQNDTYNNSGPATETFPGAPYDFEAPGSGEPWNTPSGGFK
ncbi:MULTISPECIES: ferric reductase-like transmembrane domain-containing protein [Streptomyces]|uniref:ferric reductase-like transmembrane domain-containing protein n=1 Tax=Streptomyces TaxID=1883 RepID=UPI0008948FEE|nr:MULTISPECIES: ferric reductase-like transmembrane domain-containing protein [unclassified Streptomyces]SEC44142.1 DMSO/TMAO reductase YedYZ, heme-binding membrane subunit [Streptomyces sp. PAN_FS17]SED38295.1 DMSO/TMAO reductase YedYZ, heme-binding membrane subunit [Streptomyces sp. KS_5]